MPSGPLRRLFWHVDADAAADTIVIDGTAKGRLHANTRITLRETATVNGEISAPALSVAEGATVHGRIDTGLRKAARAQGAAMPPRAATSVAAGLEDEIVSGAGV